MTTMGIRQYYLILVFSILTGLNTSCLFSDSEPTEKPLANSKESDVKKITKTVNDFDPIQMSNAAAFLKEWGKPTYDNVGMDKKAERFKFRELIYVLERVDNRLLNPKTDKYVSLNFDKMDSLSKAVYYCKGKERELFPLPRKGN